MTKNEKNMMMLGASAVLILLSVADAVEGTWVEQALKVVAILFVATLLVVTLTTAGAEK